jgi:hypothetical protein
MLPTPAFPLSTLDTRAEAAALLCAQQAVAQLPQIDQLSLALDQLLASPEVAHYSQLTNKLAPAFHVSMARDTNTGLLLYLLSQLWHQYRNTSSVRATVLVAPVPMWGAATVSGGGGGEGEGLVDRAIAVSTVLQVSPRSAFTVVGQGTAMSGPARRSVHHQRTNLKRWLNCLPKCDVHLVERKRCSMKCRARYWMRTKR